uniref:28S ribosomal protein S18a, mitochondrial n=1 Tax=Amblyomma maculatum TaxID=34609 RepID=G3MKT7_AMBMU
MALSASMGRTAVGHLFRCTALTRQFKHCYNASRERDFPAAWFFAVRESQEGNTTVIEGVFVDSPRKGRVIEPKHTSSACPLCRLGLKKINHTDVLILSQFMDSQGNMLPRDVTGLCFKQHRIVSALLYQAQRTGLIYKEEHTPKERWQELNNYFGRTKLKIDFGKPLIDITQYLEKPPQA